MTRVTSMTKDDQERLPMTRMTRDDWDDEG